MLPSWLLHPIRGFRQYLTDNPVTRLYWGIEPKSAERRRRHRRILCSPPALYIGLLVFFMVSPGLYLHFTGEYSWGSLSYDSYNSQIRGVDEAFNAIFVSAQKSGIFSVIIYAAFISIIAWWPRKEAIEEWRLTGVTGGMIFWGVASQHMAAVLLTWLLHLLLNNLAYTGFELFVSEGPAISKELSAMAHDSVLLEVCYMMAQGLAWGLAVVCAATLQVLGRNRSFVVMGTLFVAVVCAPRLWLDFEMALGLSFSLAIGVPPSWMVRNVEYLSIAEVMSWPFRIAIAGLLARWAIRRLDMSQN